MHYPINHVDEYTIGAARAYLTAREHFALATSNASAARLLRVALDASSEDLISEEELFDVVYGVIDYLEQGV
jgi:hypothetical protein